jgi:hypothetical protein
MRATIGLLTLFITLPVASETLTCKRNPKVVDKCYTVHGRANFGPGTPALRIRLIGTNRMLGVTAGPVADDADAPICPKEMLRFNAGTEEFGDFEVCPFTSDKPGHMRLVCVDSVSHLVVRQPMK